MMRTFISYFVCAIQKIVLSLTAKSYYLFSFTHHLVDLTRYGLDAYAKFFDVIKVSFMQAIIGDETTM